MICLYIGQNRSGGNAQNLLLGQQRQFLLMSDRQTRKEQSRQLANYRPSIYSRALSLYQRRSLPIVEPILRAIALSSPLSCRLPVYKTLRAASKMLMLNELQLVVVASVLKESNWDISDAVIMEYEEGVGELFCFSCEDGEYRQLTLYLLLAGWAAKSTLNEDCQDMLNEVRRVCVNFKNIFQEWSQTYAGALRLSPPQLNRLHSLLTNPLTSIHDYQLMVDTILQLSHAYNPEKDASSPRLVPRTPSSIRRNPSPQSIIKLQAEFFPPELGQIEVEQKREFEEMNVFGTKDLTQSVGFPGIFCSSMGGGFSLGSINMSKQWEKEYFQVEIGEGEHQFMVFSQAEPTLSSVFFMRRGDSVSEQLQKEEHM